MGKKITGYYSIVKTFTQDGIKLIEKSYPLPFLTYTEIEELRQRMLLQRHAFEELHIPISEQVSLNILKTGRNFKIVSLEKFEGHDFVEIVDNTNLEMYLDRMLFDIYQPLLNSTKNDYLSAGIDTVVRNYVYRPKSNEFCYVDFMPPKVSYKGHYLQEVPEISGPFYDIRLQMHNERAGVVYALYVNLSRIFPLKRRFIVSKIEQFLQEINETELSKYITGSPFYRLDSASKAIQLVRDMKDWKGINYLLLREAACAAVDFNHKFAAELDDFFKMTHHETNPDSEDYGMLPAKKFDEAKAKLIKVFSEHGSKIN